MPSVIGFTENRYKKIVCWHCEAIVQYEKTEPKWNGETDEGTKILGFNCPNCGDWIRTNS